MSLSDHFTRVFHYVLTEYIRPGREDGWRASCIFGCIYGVPVIVGLTALDYGFGVPVSNFESLLVAWSVAAVATVATHYYLGRSHRRKNAVSPRVADPLAMSIAIVAVSVVAITVFVAGLVYFSRTA